MLSRSVIVIVAVVVAGAACCNADTMAEDGACHRFVQASIAFQKTLAEKVKALNGRPVYLFDAKGFGAGLQDAVTADYVRYKTGMLDGREVDAVLSESAQRSLTGAAGAQIFLRWAGQSPDLAVDENGVHI